MSVRQERDDDFGLQEGVARPSLPQPGGGAGRRGFVGRSAVASRASGRQKFELSSRNFCRKRFRRTQIRSSGNGNRHLHAGQQHKD